MLALATQSRGIPRCSSSGPRVLPYSIGGFAQALAIAALARVETVAESIRRSNEIRQFLADTVMRIKGARVWPSQSNFVCFEHPRAQALVHALNANSIKVARLHDLDNYPRKWPDGVRVSTGPREIVEDALTCIAQQCERT